MAKSKQILSIKKKRTIGAGQTLVVDLVPFGRFNGLEYKLRYFSANSMAIKLLNLSVQKTEIDVEHMVNSISGNPLNVRTDVIKNGLNVELQVTNNEAFPVSMVLVRTKI